MSLCKECVSGVRHEGTPTGKIEVINGVNTYVALPEGAFPKEKAILFLTDAFGMQLQNNKLLADDFARNGFQVYIPDFFNGNPAPENALSDSTFTAEDRAKWLADQSPKVTRTFLDKAISGLRERGITTFGAAGYCYGARHVIDLAKENSISVAVVSHPSLLAMPGDFHDLIAKSKAPLLFNSCETDHQFPPESCKLADEVMGNGKYQPGYSREHWVGCTHGFAVRGDMLNPLIKAGKEGSFKASVEWFLKL